MEVSIDRFARETKFEKSTESTPMRLRRTSKVPSELLVRSLPDRLTCVSPENRFGRVRGTDLGQVKISSSSSCFCIL